jgi:SAM-dependent methyltransferase
MDLLSTIDIILYTGGISTRSLCSEISQGELITNNIEDIIKLSSALNSSQILVYLSTAALYEGFGDSLPNESVEISKEKLDNYSQSMYNRDIAISKLTNCNTVSLRIGMVSGISRRQRYDLAFMNMIYTSLHDKLIYVDQHNPFRSILGMHDLYRCIEKLIQHRSTIHGHHVYNLSSFNTSINDLAKYISSELDSSVQVIPNTRMENTIGFTMDTASFCKRFDYTFNETKESILALFLENKDMFYRFTTRCRICKKRGLELILDLGNQPLVNNLLLSKDDTSGRFPLNIYACKQCHHTQLGCTIPPLKMFNFYTYVSGVSSSAVAHFKMITEYLISSAKGRTSVLELASNDGCQLDFFKSAGFQTFGVDPAQNICEIANKKGHTIICDYWGDTDFSILPASFDIILAQNVLAHVPDPVKFVKKCIDYMTEDTILYLQTSQCKMYLHNEFDTVYHEHMSFFTLESFKYLADSCGLVITDMNIFPIHGSSYGLSFQKRKENQGHCKKFLDGLHEEYSAGMYLSTFYYKYRSNVIKFKYDMLNTLEENKKNYSIVGYGAAAKGITMLNYIDFADIDYIVDDCDLKYGKFTPGLKIPIVSKDVLQTDTRPLLIIILPWNIKEELTQKIRTLLQGKCIRMLIPFPSIHIV